MTKTIITILTTAMFTLPAGTALAAFADLQLIRVVYERTTGTTEIATDLGNVRNLIASGGTIAGVLPAVNDPANLFVAYFAIDHATIGTGVGDFWVSGSTSIAPLAVGAAGFSVAKNGSTSVFSYYNSLGTGTVTGEQGYINSFRSKLTASQGAMGNAITIATRPFTEASLAQLLNGTAPTVLQNLYFFENANTASSIGVKVAVIANNANGSTTILSNAAITADSTPPTVDTLTLPVTSDDRAFVAVSAFTATDDSGVVAGYLITETNVQPAATAAGWSEIPPTTYIFNTPLPLGILTPVTLYAWAKDLNGNVSLTSLSATVNVTAIDKAAPQITALVVPPAATSPTITGIIFTATDDAAVTGYLLNDTGVQPAVDNPAWSATAPTNFTFVSNLPPVGVPQQMAVYAWAKDAAGNIGTMTNVVTLTISSNTLTTPVITWTNPAAITYGTALSTTQLNATASDPVTQAIVPGTFAYSPDSGMVLSTGTQALSVIFTPTDTATYGTATATATLTVNPAVLNVTAATKSKTYGTVDPALTYAVAGFVNGDTAAVMTGSLTRAAAETVGSYAISQGTVAATTNYTIFYTGASLVISPATLTVTANSLSKMFNTINPALTYAISGYVNGESASVVSGTPILGTTAITSSPVGAYPISVTAGTLAAPNYIFSPASGLLTVTPVNLAVNPVYIPGNRSFSNMVAAVQGIIGDCSILLSSTYPAAQQPEALLFNNGFNVSLKGGMDTSGNPTAGFSTIKGSLAIRSGKIIASRVTIKQP